MNYITVNYVLKKRIKTDKHIQLTEDLKMCFNIKSGKEIMTSNNMRKGFWIGRKFYRIDRLEPFIELIPEFEYVYDDFLTNL